MRTHLPAVLTVLTLCSLSTGCARTFRTQAVPAEYTEDFDTLAAETNTLVGYELIGIAPTGVPVRVDAQAIRQHSEEAGGILGYSQGAEGIVLAPANVWFHYMKDGFDHGFMLTEDARKSLLAHEIGHQLGLAHAATGIMSTTFGGGSCWQHEAECLVEALRTGGAL